MANKNNLGCNEIEYNENNSSQACNKEFDNSEEIKKQIQGSPENNSILSDAFMADLLSENERLMCASNEKCDTISSSIVGNLSSSCHQLKDVSTFHSEVKDTSTSSKDSPDLKELANDKSSEMINSEGKNIHEEVSHVENKKEEQKEATLSSELLTIEAVDKHNEINKESYRCEMDSSTDDSSSTFSLDSKSDCSDSFLHKMQMNVNTSSSNKVTNLKTKGELDLEELPLIEDLKISVKESEIEKVGIIHAIVDTLVIVHALKNLQPLDIDSVLFLTSQKPLGRVFDVFGPISEPYYTVRFNSPEHIIDAGVTVESDVFYAPQKEEITSYVFVDELKKQKGSDASWKDNNEPPEEFIDYSDDEQEKAAKQKRKARNRPKPFDGEPQTIKRDQPSSTFRKDMQQSHNSTVAPSVVNTFRSMRPNISKSNTSNYLSMAAVMSSDYRPNSSRSQNAFQGPPIYAQSHNPFGAHQSYMPQLQHAAAPPPRNITSDRPSEVPFHPPQPFVSQPQQNLTPGPQTFSYHPPQSPMQLHQSTISQPVRFRPMYLQQQGTLSTPVAFQQSHVFGQMTPLGPMSPVQQQPPVRFAPTAMSPPPFVPVSIPPASPNFSYFSHKFASSPSPPAPGHILTNSPWFQGQSACRPHSMRYITPMSPLSIQIPNSLRTPPPTMPTNGYNAVSPIHPPQNIRPPFILQPSTHPY